jgi:hypothetical protein
MWDALSDERTGPSFTLLLVFDSTVFLGFKSHRTQDHVLLSQIEDFLGLEGQAPMPIFPTKVAMLYPQHWISFSLPSMTCKAVVEVCKI